MKQKTFRFFLDLMLLVCLALAGCGLNRPVRPGPLRGLGLFRRTPRQTC